MKIWTKIRGDISKEGFLQLFRNEVAYIAVDNFFSPEKCKNVANILIEMGLKNYAYNFDPNSAPLAEHLFETHYLYEQKTPEEYFPVAAQSIAQYKEMCQKGSCDPVKEMMDFLAHHLNQPINFAKQDGKQYTFAIARQLSSSALLHADFAHFIPSYWSISNVIAQYAWNIYLTDPQSGGECVVYNKPWEREDDKYIIGDTYGYDPIVVKDAEFVRIFIKPGQLVFFNSRNFHEVKASSHPRLSIGGHVGLTHDNEIIVWV